MFCNFICFIEQSTWNEILPLSKSVPKPPPISARPEFQAQVKRSSQVLKSKHLLQQESSLIVGSDAQTRQGKTQQMRPRAGWRFMCHSSKHDCHEQCGVNMWLYQNSWKMALEIWRLVLMEWRCPLPLWPPQALPCCSLALGCPWPVLDWPEAPRDWFFWHWGTLCRVFSYFTFPSVLRRLGAGGRLSFWSLLCLRAWLHHLGVGVLAFLATVPQEPAELVPSTVPSETFPCLLLLPACSLLRIRNSHLPGSSSDKHPASRRAWQNWNLKILSGNLLYFSAI